MTNSILIPRETFAAHMAILARVIKPQPYQQVLGSVLLRKNNAEIQLTGTDLQIAVTIQMEHAAEGNLKIALPARSLAALTSSVEGSEVELEIGDKPEAIIRCGNYRGMIRGQRTAEYPDIPRYDASTGTVVDARWFRRLLEGVLFACGEEPTRPVLNGVLFEWNGASLRLVAADGFRLAIADGELDENTTHRSFILPAQALRELVRIMMTTRAEQLTIFFPADENQVVFQSDGIQVVIRTVEGKYPDYRQIIPKSYATTVTVETDALRNLVRQIAVIARDDSYAVRFQLKQEGKIQISAQAEDTGVCRAEIPASLVGPELEIAFNSKFLLQGLDLITTGKAVFELNKHNTPVSLRADGLSPVRYILMPMHVD